MNTESAEKSMAATPYLAPLNTGPADQSVVLYTYTRQSADPTASSSAFGDHATHSTHLVQSPPWPREQPHTWR